MDEMKDPTQRTVATRPFERESGAGGGDRPGDEGTEPGVERTTSAMPEWTGGYAAPAAEGLPADGGPTPVPSAAAILGHPIHPMLVPLPIGALSLAIVSDLAYAATRDATWARTSQFLVLSGILTGALAGAFGATDFLARPRIRDHGSAWLHGGGNLLAVGLSAANLALRRNRRGRVPSAALGLSLATGTLLLVTGWLGGELSYRHRIGVTTS